MLEKTKEAHLINTFGTKLGLNNERLIWRKVIGPFPPQPFHKRREQLPWFIRYINKKMCGMIVLPCMFGKCNWDPLTRDCRREKKNSAKIMTRWLWKPLENNSCFALFSIEILPLINYCSPGIYRTIFASFRFLFLA